MSFLDALEQFMIGHKSIDTDFTYNFTTPNSKPPKKKTRMVSSQRKPLGNIQVNNLSMKVPLTITKTKQMESPKMTSLTSKLSQTSLSSPKTKSKSKEEEPILGLPVPCFTNLNPESRSKALSPLTPSESKLPKPPRTPVSRTPNELPSRIRTPGSGILSPSFRGTGKPTPFKSPTFKDIFSNYSKEEVTVKDFSSSFEILSEECGYDSDEYVEDDERFPDWVRSPLSVFDLRCANKETYDNTFTARSMGDICSYQLTKGSCSSDFDSPLNSDVPSYASIESFQIGRPIGQGKYGTIYLSRVKNKPELVVAIKVMFKSCLKKMNVKQLLRELRHLDRCQGENIIGLYDFFHDSDRIYLVMEYANGGDLYHSLCSRKRFSEVEAAKIFKQAVTAIKKAHDCGIVHRDIKPENFVFSVGNVLKLIDFGWSAPCDQYDRRKTMCGTLDYLPPEMVTSKPHGQPADIWCLGVLLFELLTGSPPFEDEDVVVTKLNIKYVSYRMPDYLSKQAKNLIDGILQGEPSSRLSINDILKHPWMNQCLQ